MEDNSVDAVVTDPPYGIRFMGKAWDKFDIDVQANARRKGHERLPPPRPRGGGSDATHAGSYDFTPDGMRAFQDFTFEWCREALRVLKPGGHLASFSSTRTYHRMACAIEDAGFEVRDQLAWCYGVGFPKSHNVSRNLDDARCRCEEVSECIVRPVLNADVSKAVAHGEMRREVLLASVSQQSPSTHGESDGSCVDDWTEQSSMEGRSNIPTSPWQLRASEVRSLPDGIEGDGQGGRLCNGASLGDGEVGGTPSRADGMRSPHRSPAAQQRASEFGTVAGQSEPQERRAWNHCERCGKPIIPDGLGTALKPAWEPICLARKPLSERTVAANCLRWGTGAINVDGCRIEAGADHAANCDRNNVKGIWGGVKGANVKASPQGRFPANLCHDGSDEVLDLFPETAPARRGNKGLDTGIQGGRFAAGERAPWVDCIKGHDDNGGSAARFFYAAKASKHDRAGSRHPTVKPVKLMQWLVRLITPPGGVVLDPFAGSGTTGAAAILEGFRPILIEREAEYIADIRRRLKENDKWPSLPPPSEAPCPSPRSRGRAAVIPSLIEPMLF